MKEYFVVVDTKDNVTGKATRKECHRNKSLIHRGVTMLVLNRKGDILLEKRSMKKDLNAGYWSLVGGHVDSGESYVESARREIKEEIGVECKVSMLFKALLRMKQETEMEGVFSCVHEGPFKVNKEESDEVRFFRPKEIKKMMKAGKMPDGDVQVLERHFSELIKH